MTTFAHGATARTYLVIWGWLAGLMLISVLLSTLPMAASTVAWIVFGLSTVKALLVSFYYMHLKFDRRWLLVVAGFPLMIMLLALGVVASSHFVKL